MISQTESKETKLQRNWKKNNQIENYGISKNQVMEQEKSNRDYEITRNQVMQQTKASKQIKDHVNSINQAFRSEQNLSHRLKASKKNQQAWDCEQPSRKAGKKRAKQNGDY